MNPGKESFWDRILRARRAKVLINKNFQLKFSAFCLIPIFLIQVMFWLAIEMFFHKMIKKAQAFNLPAGHDFYKLLAQQKKELMFLLLCSSVFVAVVMFIWGIYTSHRIAGPFYKMERYLLETKNLDEAKKSKLCFRKKDFFLNIPKAFNEFIERIS
jgi:ABC-type multidrug transport system permease subunit